jgi:hypothetical protein
MQNTTNSVSVSSDSPKPGVDTLIGECFRDTASGEIYILTRGGPRQCQFSSLSTGLRRGSGYSGVQSTQTFQLPSGLEQVKGSVTIDCA